MADTEDPRPQVEQFTFNYDIVIKGKMEGYENINSDELSNVVDIINKQIAGMKVGITVDGSVYPLSDVKIVLADIHLALE